MIKEHYCECGHAKTSHLMGVGCVGVKEPYSNESPIDKEVCGCRNEYSNKEKNRQKKTK